MEKSKNYNQYQTKNASLEIKDVSTDTRKVAIYLAGFDNVDSCGDVLRKGCFAKSISENGPASASNRKIQFLRYHDWEQQIGKFESLEEDDKGLFAVAYCGTSTKGNDALCDYVDGVIREHSIGFNYVADKLKWVDDATMPRGGYWDVAEVKLWEGSAVTFGANPETPFVGMKSLAEKADAILKLQDEQQKLIKSLRNGQGSDERLQQIEMKVAFINSQIASLAVAEPFVKEHLETPKPIDVFGELSQFIKTI